MGMIRSLVCAVLVVHGAGCLGIDREACGDRYCPSGLVCSPDENLCVQPVQIDACNSAVDGTFCTYAGVPSGTCAAGVCIGSATSLAAPANFVASDGTSTTSVALSWESVAGASGYRVWRDSLAIGDVAETSYADTGAGQGAVPAAPADVVATLGTHADRVEVTWSPAVTSAGTAHTYFVTALAGDEIGPMSEPDAGNRAAEPVTGYEIALDGGAFTALGVVTSYTDATAPAGSYTATITASDGAPGGVTMQVSAPTPVAGATRSYVVRAISAAGNGGESTASGHRAAGTFQGYQWQRSASAVDGNYTDLTGATAATFVDSMVPSLQARWYRCVLTAASSDPSYVRDAGYRGVSTTARASGLVVGGKLDASVDAFAVGAGKIYIGGSFRYVGPATGSFAAIAAASGAVDVNRAKVSGESAQVNAVVSDGAGGWYIGGTFTHVDGVARDKLAHITAAGALDMTFDASAGDDVYALALSGTTLYVGGRFTSLGGAARGYLGAVDATTGAVTAWQPMLNGSSATRAVRALAVVGGNLYVGGAFNTANSTARNNLAAFDTTSGALTAFDPNVNSEVRALAVSGTTLYAAGDFSMLGTDLRDRLAAFDTSTGGLTAWAPDTGGGSVLALAVSGSTIYLAGAFSSVGGQLRSRLAALDTAGNVTSWNPTADEDVSAIAVNGSTVYVGGEFTTVGGQARPNLAALDASTGLATAWSPLAERGVYALAVAGANVYVGGSFRSIGGSTRENLAALDASTGALLPWNPRLLFTAQGANQDNANVRSLQLAGGTLYVGGAFEASAGTPRRNVAAFDDATGALTAWNPNADNTVFALHAQGNTIYAGGAFGSIGGQPRSRIAALDLSGNATTWAPSADGLVRAFTVAGTTLYVGGDFGTIAGTARARLAAFALPSGDLVSGWNPGVAYTEAGGYVATLASLGNAIYAGGSLGANGPVTLGGASRRHLVALDATSGTALPWAPDPSSTVWKVAVIGDFIFVGGNFATISGQPRAHLAGLDPTSATLASMSLDLDGSVSAFLAHNGALYVGGSFQTIAARTRVGLAIFDP